MQASASLTKISLNRSKKYLSPGGKHKSKTTHVAVTLNLTTIHRVVQIAWTLKGFKEF